MKITASQCTPSSPIADLAGQTLVLPVTLIAYFWTQTFIFNEVVHLMRLILYHCHDYAML